MERATHIVKRVYEIYNPGTWLQVYYPLYYLAKAIKRKELHQKGANWGGHNRGIAELAVPLAVATFVFWIIWINIRLLFQHIFAKEKLKTSQITESRKAYGSNQVKPSESSFYVAQRLCADDVAILLEISALLALALYDWPRLIIISALLAWRIRINFYSSKQATNVANPDSLPRTITSTVGKETPLYISEYVRVAQSISTMTSLIVLSILCISSALPKHTGFPLFLQLVLGIAVMNNSTGREIVVQRLRKYAVSRLRKENAIVQGSDIFAEALAGIDVLFISTSSNLGRNPIFDSTGEDTSIKLLKSLGISVKIMTSGTANTAKEAATLLTLEDGEIFSAGALQEHLDGNSGEPEPDVVKRMLGAGGFAEASPEDKEVLVTFFRDQGLRVAVTGYDAQDQAVLAQADCGIALNGASEPARAVADILYLAPGFSRIVDSVQISRQVFQQVRTYLVYHTAISLHLTVIVFGSYMIYGRAPADLRWFMITLHISDIVGIQLSYDDGRTPFSKRPTRWSNTKILRTILALTAVLIAGTCLTILLTPASLERFKITFSQQTAFLNAVLTDLWQCLLLLTNGMFWTHISHWKSLGIVLAFEIPTRLSYFGWAAEGVVDLGVTIRLWLVALGILFASAVVCWFTADSELIYKRVRFEEQEGLSEAKEVIGGISTERTSS